MITFDQLKAIAPHTPRSAESLVPFLNEAMDKYAIDTPKRQAFFLAQVAHESGSFIYKAEIASGKAYEGRKDLGNVIAGDGVRFKGRGLIQISGRSNYQSLSIDLGIDFISDPKLLEQDRYAALSAGWFWNHKNLNRFADLPDEWRSQTKGYSPFQYVVYLVNGGQNGIEDRKAYLARALKVLCP